jgi:hypothetical protein
MCLRTLNVVFAGIFKNKGIEGFQLRPWVLLKTVINFKTVGCGFFFLKLPDICPTFTNFEQKKHPILTFTNFFKCEVL